VDDDGRKQEPAEGSAELQKGFFHHSTGYFWAEREKKKEEKKEL